MVDVAVEHHGVLRTREQLLGGGRREREDPAVPRCGGLERPEPPVERDERWWRPSSRGVEPGQDAAEDPESASPSSASTRAAPSPCHQDISRLLAVTMGAPSRVSPHCAR